uniref:N-acylethanolamine acid amidase n=1 Tax=Crocodylus porosus TaxID=8502 RepID=A0A7M4EIK2_CROPO
MGAGRGLFRAAPDAMGRRVAGWALLLLSLLGAVSAGAAPLCNVSLDGDPDLRWLPVLQRFEPGLQTIPKWVHTVIRPLAAELEFFIPQPFAGEIQGICNALGMSVGDGILLSLAYEATAFCTSIVAQDYKGNIYHGRNLDYDFGDILRKITIDVQFIKNGQVWFVCDIN